MCQAENIKEVDFISLTGKQNAWNSSPALEVSLQLLFFVIPDEFPDFSNLVKLFFACVNRDVTMKSGSEDKAKSN